MILVLAVFLTGCLKDDNFDDGTIQSNHTTGNLIKPIELKISATDNTKFATVSVNSSPNDTTSDFLPVVLATSEPATEDIHVTIELADSLVSNYNDANDAGYKIPEDSIYQIPSLVVTIPKGSNTGYLQIKYHIPDFVGRDLALGFKIVSVQEAGYTISGNFNDGVVALAVKNKYDGVYKGSGTMVHPSYGGTYTNKDENMITSGANSVSFQLNTTVSFSAAVDLDVDQATNLVTLTSNSVDLDPYDTASNYYDPTTQTFHLDFGYSGGTRHVTMTAVYNRPR